MAIINVPGTLHSFETGNVLAKANELLDDSLNKKQNVINSELTSDVSDLKTAVGTGGSVDSRIAAAKTEILGDASTDYNTLGKVEDSIESIDSTLENAAYLGTDSGSAVIAGFDPQSDTLWKKAQVLSTAQKNQVKTNLGLDSDFEVVYSLYRALNQSDIVVGAKPSTGNTNTIYRVPGESSYTDWMYYNSSWIEMATYNNAIDNEPTAGSNNLVKSGGVDSFMASYGYTTNSTFNRAIKALYIDFGTSGYGYDDLTISFLFWRESDNYVMIRGRLNNNTLLSWEGIASNPNYFIKSYLGIVCYIVIDWNAVPIVDGAHRLGVPDGMGYPVISIVELKEAFFARIQDQSITVEQIANIDNTPTQGSNNLVKSGGVASNYSPIVPTQDLSWNKAFLALNIDFGTTGYTYEDVKLDLLYKRASDNYFLFYAYINNTIWDLQGFLPVGNYYYGTKNGVTIKMFINWDCVPIDGNGDYRLGVANETMIPVNPVVAVSGYYPQFDDEVSITNLQTYINNNRVVNLGVGTFYIDTPITIPSNTKITGVRGGTILQLRNAETIFDIDGTKTNIEIENISFVGKNRVASLTTQSYADLRTISGKPITGGTATDVGIYVHNGAKGVHINDCTFQSFGYAGIRLKRTIGAGSSADYDRQTKLTNCEMFENWYGLILEDRAEFTSIIGCNFSNNQIGCYCDSANNYFTGCLLTRNYFCGFALIGMLNSSLEDSNDVHSTFIGGEIVHNGSNSGTDDGTYDIVALDVTSGYVISNTLIAVQGILLASSKGILINGCNIVSRIYIKDDVSGCNMVSNCIFRNAYSWNYDLIDGTDTHLALIGNRWWDGHDKSSINNNN